VKTRNLTKLQKSPSASARGLCSFFRNIGDKDSRGFVESINRGTRMHDSEKTPESLHRAKGMVVFGLTSLLTERLNLQQRRLAR
jgi:hypothetical protein